MAFHCALKFYTSYSYSLIIYLITNRKKNNCISIRFLNIQPSCKSSKVGTLSTINCFSRVDFAKYENLDVLKVLKIL